VALNIDGKQKTKGRADQPARSRKLVEEVVDELTSWNPREFLHAFRRWHQGSFSLIHLNVLTLLEAEGPQAMSRLAEALDVSVASMTGIVDRMETRGLVERRHDVSDRRVVLVHTAEGGRKVFAEIDTRRRQALHKLLDDLTDDQLAGLLSGHRALRDARRRFAETMTARQLPDSDLVAVEAKK
jgi:DNA-binding MarR family transcriptional regulator